MSGLTVLRLVHQHVAVQELEVRHVRHDGGADVQVGAQPSDVIEMGMRGDQPPDRLVRRQLRDRLDDRQAALFARRCLEHGHERVEFHHVAVGGSAAEQVHAARQLVDRHLHRERRLRD